MVHVAAAVRQHEIIQENVIVGQALERLGYRKLSPLSDKPVTPSVKFLFEHRKSEYRREEADERHSDVAGCENRDYGQGEPEGRAFQIFTDLLISEFSALSEHQHNVAR